MIDKKIGIYGGTFDPIHNGHLRVVVELLTRKVVDQIVLVPAGQPLLKENQPIAKSEDRLKMCQLAITDLPSDIRNKVLVSDVEINRPGPSYAIDTVDFFEKENPSKELFWILGSDAYSNIENWHRSVELQEKVNFIVIDRPGTADGSAMDIDAIDISSTKIRNDKTFSAVSTSVRKYILEKKLYVSK